MTGPRARQRPRAKIDDRICHRDEASRIEVLRDDPVGVDEEQSRRGVLPAQRQHQSLELRHVERGRRPLPCDVGDENAQAIVLEREKVVVVPPTSRAGSQCPVSETPGTRIGPCGRSDIWMLRAMRSSCSSRSFSAFSTSSPSMLAVIELNELASSPS